MDPDDDMTTKSTKKAKGSSKKKGRPSYTLIILIYLTRIDSEDDGTSKTPQKGEVSLITPDSNEHGNGKYDRWKSDFTQFNDP